jgi:hypothetical protein
MIGPTRQIHQLVRSCRTRAGPRSRAAFIAARVTRSQDVPGDDQADRARCVRLGTAGFDDRSKDDQDQEVRHQHFHDHRIDDGDIRTEPGKSEMARFPGMPVSEESDRPPIVWPPSVNGISQPAVDVVRPFAGRPSRLRRGPR